MELREMIKLGLAVTFALLFAELYAKVGGTAPQWYDYVALASAVSAVLFLSYERYKFYEPTGLGTRVIAAAVFGIVFGFVVYIIDCVASVIAFALPFIYVVQLGFRIAIDVPLIGLAASLIVAE